MKKVILIIFVLALLFAAGCQTGGTRAMRNASISMAREFLDEFYSANNDMFRYEVHMRAGSFLSVTDTDSVYQDGLFVVSVTAEHMNRLVLWTFTYEETDGELFLARIESAFEFRPPVEFDLPEGIIEEAVVVGVESGYPLDGRLTLPANLPEGERIPAVVLVHGHGPWDMDLSVFDNRPFMDIAHYLAANGIAVLRYDKITLRHPEALYDFYGGNLTAELETVFDAAWARVFLRADERIDQERVFVLGHGFGGSVAAWIAAKYGYTGWISMAGSPRTLVELLADSQMFLAEGEGLGEDVLLELHAEHLRAAELHSALPEAMAYEILGVRGYFLNSLIETSPLQFYDLPMPALVLQGTNDFRNFFDRDFEMFKDFMMDNPYAEFNLYEGLNHFFMWSTMERPDIRDYSPRMNVERTVLSDIVDWVGRN